MQVLGSVLILGYVIWRIYHRFWPKEATYQDHIRKATHYETYFRFKKALMTYQKAQALPNLTSVQQASLDWSCGNCLLKLKQYKEAARYFDRLFEGQEARDLFRYTGQVKRVLKGYLLAHEHEKARRLYERFVKRAEGASHIKKLKRLKEQIDAKG